MLKGGNLFSLRVLRSIKMIEKAAENEPPYTQTHSHAHTQIHQGRFFAYENDQSRLPSNHRDYILSFDVHLASPLRGESDDITFKLLFNPEVPRVSAAGGITGCQTGSSDKEQGGQETAASCENPPAKSTPSLWTTVVPRAQCQGAGTLEVSFPLCKMLCRTRSHPPLTKPLPSRSSCIEIPQLHHLCASSAAADPE